MSDKLDLSNVERMLSHSDTKNLTLTEYEPGLWFLKHDGFVVSSATTQKDLDGMAFWIAGFNWANNDPRKK